MKIIEVNEFSNEYFRFCAYVFKVAYSGRKTIYGGGFQRIACFRQRSSVFLLDDNTIAGMATVGICRSPTGSKAWLEVDKLMLTSHPSRIAANNLYRSIGFEQYETNMYRLKLGNK